MTNPSRSIFRPIALVAVLLIALPLTLAAQGRQRLVKRLSADAATLSGRVIDAGSHAPVAGALVKVGGKFFETAADGQFSFEGLTANSFRVEVVRWGYVDFSQVYALVKGTNQIEIELSQTPASASPAARRSSFRLPR
jgi:hypothetical protein